MYQSSNGNITGSKSQSKLDGYCILNYKISLMWFTELTTINLKQMSH